MLVQLLNLLLSVSVDCSEDVLAVVFHAVHFELMEHIRVLWKHATMEELFGDAESFAFLFPSYVNELALAIVYYIVVTN